MVFGNSGHGHHSGCGSGNGGHGSGGFGHWNNNDNKSSGQSAADELKFVPFQDGKLNKVTYVAVKEHIVNFIRKNHKHGNAIATH